MLDEFLDLFLPTKCLQCFRPPSVLCRSCAAGFDLPAHPVNRGPLSGFSIVDYSAEVSQLIDKYKEHGVTSVAKVLARPMTANLLANGSPGDLLVVPPSSRESIRRRGYEPAMLLAVQMASQARKAGLELIVARQALSLVEPVHDQAQLNARQRFENLANAMVGQPWLAGQQIILIDDIVTTGATLLECRRAVEQAGGSVRFFSTFAETKSKNATRS